MYFWLTKLWRKLTGVWRRQQHAASAEENIQAAPQAQAAAAAPAYAQATAAQPPAATQSQAAHAPAAPQGRSEDAQNVKPPPITPQTSPVAFAPYLEPPPLPQQKYNRQQRRALNAYERARRKQDKWVIPKGPEPIPYTRTARQPVQEDENLLAPPPPPDCPDAEQLIIDKINDVDEDVLIRESEFWGQYSFRDTILDQLARYWVYIERMRKHDKDAYGFYKNVGATLVPYVMTGTHSSKEKTDAHKMTKEEIAQFRSEIMLPPWFKHQRPAFGCFAYGAHPMAEKAETIHSKPQKGKPHTHLWVPKFMYYVKYHRPPPEVQPMSGGDIYKMTVWWDKPQDKKLKWGRPNDFAVFISDDGKDIIVLKQCDTKYIRVHAKKHKAGHEFFRIPQRAWHIPEGYEEWARDWGLTVQDHLAHMFCSCVRKQEHTNLGMVRIAVHKDDLTAVFTLDVRRMAYFFQDRDIVLNVHGHRKRIFHVVRAHKRKDSVIIKTHVRGLRQFTWAGYEVDITVPGLDHIPLNEISVGFDDGYWWEGKHDVNMLSEEKLGEFIVDEIIKGGRGL